jgi:hypothetical protein
VADAGKVDCAGGGTLHGSFVKGKIHFDGVGVKMSIAEFIQKKVLLPRLQKTGRLVVYYT